MYSYKIKNITTYEISMMKHKCVTNDEISNSHIKVHFTRDDKNDSWNDNSDIMMNENDVPITRYILMNITFLR